MLQVVYETDFRILRAEALNNFQPGGKEYWIVYSTKQFPESPAVFEDLSRAAEWIKYKAGKKSAFDPQYSTTQSDNQS